MASMWFPREKALNPLLKFSSCKPIQTLESEKRRRLKKAQIVLFSLPVGSASIFSLPEDVTKLL